MAHFGELLPAHLHGFTRLLLTCREHFDGDLDQLLILCIISTRVLQGDSFKGYSYQRYLDCRQSTDPLPRINVQSIAACSGIPRETVRRKVEALIARGWVKRNGDRTLEPLYRESARDLKPVTDDLIEYLVAMGQLLLDRCSQDKQLDAGDNAPGNSHPGAPQRHPGLTRRSP